MKIKVPFPVFYYLAAEDEVEIAIPLGDLYASWSAPETDVQLQIYQASLQKELRTDGLQALLNEPPVCELQSDSLALRFEAGELQPHQPQLLTHWTYFFGPQSGGVYGVLPILRLEAWGKTPALLKQNLSKLLKEHILLQRPESRVERILQAQWPVNTRLVMRELELDLPRLYDGGSQEAQQESEGDSILREVASSLRPDRRMAFGMESCIQALLPKLNKKKGQAEHILIVGPAGSGKTTLMLELIRCLATAFPERRVWETQAARLMRGLLRNGGWEAGLPVLLHELNRDKGVLFVNRLRDLFEIGQYLGNEVSVGEALLDELPNARFSLLAECSKEELAWMELRKPGLAQLFHVFRMEDASLDFEAIAQKKARAMADQIGLKINEKAVQESLKLVQRFFPYSGKPGKALRFVESVLMAQLQAEEKSTVDVHQVRVQFSRQTGIPVLLLDSEQALTPGQIRAFFRQTFFGQDAAVDRVTNMLMRMKANLIRPGKPIGSFLFAGPSGVGKTELAKQLAHFIFGSRDRLVRFDMSEYSQQVAVLRLIASAGPDGGLLTQAIRQQPFSVLLFDEIEKAHPVFFDLLLQILGEGRLTDSSGQFTEFGSTILIMTSNLGSENMHQKRISLSTANPAEELESQFEKAVRQAFRPELFNRIDYLVPFLPLDESAQKQVLQREINAFRQRYGFESRSVEMHISDRAMAWFLSEGFDNPYGARHLQRSLRKELFLPVVRILNQYDTDEKIRIAVDVDIRQALTFEVESDAMPLEQFIDELERTSLAEYSGKLRRKFLKWRSRPSWETIAKGYERYTSKLEKGRKLTENEAKDMSRFKQLNKGYQDLLGEIERLEESLIKAVALGAESIQTDTLQQQLDQWNRKYLELLLEVVALNHPQENHCSFFLVGSRVDPLLEMYDRIFEAKQFERSYFCWWPKRAGENAKKKKSHSEDTYAFSPAADIDQLLRLMEKKPDAFAEIRLNGPGCMMYCSPEWGVHQWEDKKGNYMYIRVLASAEPAPPNWFYAFDPHLIKENDIARKITPSRIEQPSPNQEDKYDWRYGVSGKNHHEVLKAHLDEMFEQELLRSI